MTDIILFDFDGTLFDTVEGITKCTQYALKKQGIEAELDELRCFAGPPLVEMFAEKYGMDEIRARQAQKDFEERYVPIGITECRPFDGIGDFLRDIKAAGKKLCVATSKPEWMAVKLLEREGLLALFDVVKGSAMGDNIPKWQIIRRVMESVGGTDDTCVLVGDTKWDVIGAHRSGLKCVGVRYGYAADGELERAGADYIADDLEGLKKLLLSI